jgi:hypothetical protein
MTAQAGSRMSEIFLSYARADDNVPKVMPGAVGWVSFFHCCLQDLLRQKLYWEFDFWRDSSDIEGDARFERKIMEGLQRAMLMVAIVSPNYLSRPWCQWELKEFIRLQLAPNNDDRDERVLKILKHNVPEAEMPEPLRNRGRGYRFYEMDPERNIELPFFMNGRLSLAREQAYFEQLNMIAEGIVARLRPAITAPAAAEPTPVAINQAVFVAPPPRSSSVYEIYLALVGELTKLGVVVRPTVEERTPETLQEVQGSLSACLSDATIAIHLIGESGGITPDGAGESIAMLQLRQSLEVQRQRADLQRVIWLPSTVKPAGEPHRALVQALRDFDQAAAPLLPGRDELETNSYDAFLGLVQRKLARQSRAQTSQAEPLNVAVLAADPDIDVARSTLRALLKKAGALTLPPLPPDRAAAERDADQRQRLLKAGRAVVLWRSQDVVSVEVMLARLRDWQSLGRPGPFEAIAVAVMEPATREKQNEDPTGPGEYLIDLRSGAEVELLAHLAPLLGVRA